MSHRGLRIGLVGCGQIADAHLQQIRRVSNAETVAVCDVEPLLARQAAEGFGVPMQFSSLTVRILRGESYPGAFAKLEVPLQQVRESCGNLKRNAGRFLRGRLHYFEGMKRLFENFYDVVRDGTARETSEVSPPVTHREALRVTSIMDRIFDQCRGDPSDSAFAEQRRTTNTEPAPNVVAPLEADSELVAQGHA
jgi:hypothetical protein